MSRAVDKETGEKNARRLATGELEKLPGDRALGLRRSVKGLRKSAEPTLDSSPEPDLFEALTKS